MSVRVELLATAMAMAAAPSSPACTLQRRRDLRMVLLPSARARYAMPSSPTSESLRSKESSTMRLCLSDMDRE